MTDTASRLAAALSDRYTIERELGSGGMATVYLATDLKHRRHVGIKVLRPELAAVLGRERFLNEIETVAQLNHPHIMPLHDSGEAGGFLYYVMPVVEGESLRDRLEREQQLRVSDIVKLTAQIASALDYAHRQGVIHRDIKPENILLHEGEAMVTDFGISLAVRDAGSTRLTEAGYSIGTPDYMSPEQAAGMEEIDGRSDQYSLGCVVYEMLAGEPPFGGPTAAVLTKHMTEPPPQVRTARSELSQAVDAALGGALAKAAADRFDSAGEFAAALERSMSADADTVSKRPPRLAWTKIAVLLAALAGVGILGARMLGSSPVIPFEDQNWVLIAETDNATGDSIFDQSLVTALTVGLQQSPRINVLSPARIYGALRRMGGGVVPDSLANAPLDETLAREISVRENAAAVVVPSIERIDSLYVVSLRVVDPATGDPLLSLSVRASGRAEVITELDELTRQLRRDLGESLLSVARNAIPMDQATTFSLEALKAYSEGRRAFNTQRPDDGVTLYLRAVELDSNFAMAHKGLAFYYYYNRSDRVRGDYHYEKALSLRDRLTELERLSIQGDGSFAREDYEGAAGAYRILVSRYPEDRAAWTNLGLSYMRLSQYDLAIATLHEALARDSTNNSAFVNLATSFTAANRPDSALVYYRMTFERFPNMRVFANLNHEFGFTFVRAGFLDSAAAVFSEMLSRSRSDQSQGHRSLALLDMYRGHYRDAIPELREALVLSIATEAPTTELRNLLYLASVHQMLDQSTEFTTVLTRAREVAWRESINPFWLSILAKLYIRGGMVDEGAEVADTMAARADSMSRTDNAVLNLIRGELTLAREGCADALSELELAHALRHDSYFLESIAYCHMLADELDQAATRYAGIVARPDLGWEGQEVSILAHYYLGTIREAQGDTVAAIGHYNDFLQFWESGDADIPMLMDARQRLVNLIGPR